MKPLVAITAALFLAIICIWLIVIDRAEAERIRNIRAVKAMAQDKRLKECKVRDVDMLCTYTRAGVRRTRIVEY